jgi:hypothetical protein
MARKALPAHPTRDRTRDDESLLLRSAESLGRMIGSLQRQLDVATGRLTGGKPNGSGRRRVAAARSSAKAKSGTTGTRAVARRKSSAERKSTKKR